MSSERLEFSANISGFFLGVLGPELTPRIRQQLAEAGLDLSRPLQPAYPAEDYYRWLRLLARALYPNLPEEAAHRALGARAVSGLEATFVGRALSRLIRLIGIRRSLHRLTQNFRWGNNYTEVWGVELEHTCLQLTFNTVMGMPHYFAGVLEAGVRMLGGKQVDVTVLPGPGEACTYRVRWQD